MLDGSWSEQYPSQVNMLWSSKIQAAVIPSFRMDLDSRIVRPLHLATPSPLSRTP